MSEHAPQGILDLFDMIHDGIPQAINAGIVGDSAHGYGYHRGRNYVADDDYSVQLSEDQQGSGDAACALDLSWTDIGWQYTVSQRLLNAKHDDRMRACRSFFGATSTTSGVIGWDFVGGYPVTSDDSHQWHVHLSILRKYSNDTDALAGIAAVITGSSGEDDDVNDQDIEKIAQKVWGYAIRNDVTGKTAAAWAFLNSINKGVHDMPGSVWNTQVRNDVTGAPSPAWAFLTSLNTQVNETNDNVKTLLD